MLINKVFRIKATGEGFSIKDTQSLFSSDPVYKLYEYNGLKGRYAHWPAIDRKAKRTFVLIYGQHATLERIQPIAEALTTYGDVYIVDSPGFGGMEASYKIKQTPDLKFFAGHLEHFITKYIPDDRQLTFMGISYGFQIVTTMLADNKELQARTEDVISLAGFVTYKDFSMPLSYHVFLRYMLANIMRTNMGSKLIDFASRPSMIRFIYFLSRPFNVQQKSLSKAEINDYVNQQIWLWHIGDSRTHAKTAWDFWETNDLTSLRLNTSVIHVGVPRDHLLKNAQVAEELRSMYAKSTILDLNLASHAPLEVDNSDKVKKLLPDTLKTLLMRSNNETPGSV